MVLVFVDILGYWSAASMVQTPGYAPGGNSSSHYLNTQLCNQARIPHPRSFTCETCGKGFPSRYKLKRHSVCHTGEKPHKCMICGRGYTQSNDLKYHEKRVHPEMYVAHALSKDGADMETDPTESRRQDAQYILNVAMDEYTRESHTDENKQKSNNEENEKCNEQEINNENERCIKEESNNEENEQSQEDKGE